MKCEKCGGNLTLEDVVCPYCEALNEHAVQHIREMNRYKREFEGTREDVYSVTKSYVGISTRIIVIAVLVVLTIVCGLLSGEVYSIRSNMLKAEAKKNLEESKATLDAFLESRDYYALAAFSNEKRISAYDEEFEEYGTMIYAAKQYSFLYDYVMKGVKPYEGMDMQNNVKWIAEQLTAFYKIFDPEYVRYVGEAGADYEHALQMQEQIQALLMAYCNLTGEDVENLATMTNAERAILLEERIIHEE